MIVWATQISGAVSQSTALEDIIVNVFSDAILKIDVSSNTIKIENNKNVCVSEGTGFLVGSNHLITAEHVYKLPDGCGDPIIIVKSRRYNFQSVAKIVDAIDDAALLSFSDATPRKMCALKVARVDEYAQEAIRLAIRGGLHDPRHANIKIGKHDDEFKPLVVMLPGWTERGESGGPVIAKLRVVGIIKSRVEQYRDMSLMMRSELIRSLMKRNVVEIGSNICNPTEWEDETLSGSFDIARKITISSSFDDITRKDLYFNLLKLVPSALNRNREANLSALFNGDSLWVTSGVLPLASTSGWPTSGTRPIESSASESIRAKAVEEAVATLEDILDEVLWRRFIEEGRATGKWSGPAASDMCPDSQGSTRYDCLKH